jgi:hypothetical protein
MLKQGDRVCVDSKEATVECCWGSGKHTTWRLSDGREIVDLHLAVESGAARIVEGPTKTFDKSKSIKKCFDFGRDDKPERMPRDGEDLEE